MNVSIFFFRPWLGAGVTAFTAHLFKAFALAGHTPTIYRVLDAAQDYDHPFGAYAGVAYRIVTMAEARALVKGAPSIMSAVMKPPHVRDGIVDGLLALGLRPVIHDEREAAAYDWNPAHRPICVRKALAAIVPGSVYLPQPYLRANLAVGTAKAGAVSLARVAPSKRTSLLLDANRQLPEAMRIRVLGAGERSPYAKSLARDYADVWPTGGQANFSPAAFETPLSLAAPALLNVDLSHFERDGGGTQYAQLEAMDAACVNVMHEDWFRFDGDLKAGTHAVTITDAASLATLVAAGASGIDCAAINANCAALLEAHSAKSLGTVYMDELLRT